MDRVTEGQIDGWIKVRRRRGLVWTLGETDRQTDAQKNGMTDMTSWPRASSDDNRMEKRRK